MKLPQGLSITYLGHASFKISTPGGKVVFIDPWLEGNPRCPDAHKKQDRADLILITHGHFDHLSADVAPLARATGATVVAMPEVCAFLSRQGLERFEQMNKGGTIEVMGLRVTMTNAFHSSGAQAEDGSVVYAGDPAGFVLQTEDGFRLYHAGDTCVFGDMKLIGELYRPQVAMLPIGDRFTMGPVEAAHAIRLLGVKCVIPMHYATFPLLTGTPEALKEATRDIEGLEIVVMEPGQTWAG